MHDQLYSSPLNSASGLTHLFSSGKSPGCFPFLIHLLLLCVCTHLSLFLIPCHPRLPPLLLCVTLSILIYDAMKHNMVVNFFPPSLFPLDQSPPLLVSSLFLIFFILCLITSSTPSLFAFPLVSLPPSSFSFSPHLSSSSCCLSSCSSLPSLESFSFRLFH